MRRTDKPKGRGRGEGVITEIEIEGFKSLEKVKLKLGAFNLFIGANASGKSNFLDALLFLQGIGNGFSIDEIFQGKPKGATSEVWEGIRGGITKAKFMRLGSGSGEDRHVSFRVNLKSRNIHSSRELLYSISFLPAEGSIESEILESDSQLIFSLSPETGEFSDSWRLREQNKRGRPALQSVPYPGLFGEMSSAETCARLLSNQQRLHPEPEVLRNYGVPYEVKRMGEAGENFASLVRTISGTETHRSAYEAWLHQLLSSEAGVVDLMHGALGEPLFALRRGNYTYPASILSDGTLRFAALTAAFFQLDMPDLIKIEEIENGIHPTRVRLLLELLKSQSGGDGPQVFATTHSPVVLAWLDESDYETTFFCKRDEETGASIIKPLSEVPHLIDIIHKHHSLGDLFMQGWMEAAL
jgi:predicted ATPase